MRLAAYGSVTLVSVAKPRAFSVSRQNVAGAKVLASSTGTVGHVLAAKQSHAEKQATKAVFKEDAADMAEAVCDALQQTIQTLLAKLPAEVPAFRQVVDTAIAEAMASTSGPTPAEAVMIEKINAAMGNTSE